MEPAFGYPDSEVRHFLVPFFALIILDLDSLVRHNLYIRQNRKRPILAR